jgi:hypothetical protein
MCWVKSGLPRLWQITLQYCRALEDIQTLDLSNMKQECWTLRSDIWWKASFAIHFTGFEFKNLKVHEIYDLCSVTYWFSVRWVTFWKLDLSFMVYWTSKNHNSIGALITKFHRSQSSSYWNKIRWWAGRQALPLCVLYKERMRMENFHSNAF